MLRCVYLEAPSRDSWLLDARVKQVDEKVEKNVDGGEMGRPEDAGVDGAAPVRVKRPWWLPHFLGRVPIGLEPKHVSLVGVVALAGFFENYDVSVLSAALKQIRESFGLGQAEMTSLLAWIRLGAIPALLPLRVK